MQLLLAEPELTFDKAFKTAIVIGPWKRWKETKDLQDVPTTACCSPTLGTLMEGRHWLISMHAKPP